MYKCGWNGCEKAYGTLNHLNAHVTMQAHGQKRTPEGKTIFSPPPFFFPPGDEDAFCPMFHPKFIYALGYRVNEGTPFSWFTKLAPAARTSCIDCELVLAPSRGLAS